MSDTEAEVSTSTESTEVASAPAAETTQATESSESTPVLESAAPTRPAGYDPVDVKNATPEQIEERINYLYKQVKPKERENREMRQLLAEQSRVINELSQGQRAVVGHLTQQSFADNKERLKNDMQEAWKKGDNTAYIDAQNRLMDLQVEERVAAKTQPQQQTTQQQFAPTNAVEVANRAIQSGVINESEYRATETWQNERDESGNLVRPWAFGTDNRYQAALRETAAVFDNPRYENYSYDQKLAEVDRRMGTAKRTTTQNVMGGSLTKVAKNTKIELSPKQREIALKTKYAGKGKSEADHLDAYRKQIEKYSSRRAK